MAGTAPPRIDQVGRAIRTLSDLVGPTFTGVLKLHYKEGDFQLVEFPPEKLTIKQLDSLLSDGQSPSLLCETHRSA